MMHWVDAVAEDLLKRGNEHVVASGTSISGQIHIGNASEVIMSDGIIRSVERLGGTGRNLWIMDDMDPLRSVPAQIPQSFNRYLGVPDHRIPCPDDTCSSFIEYFAEPFLEELAGEILRDVPGIVSVTYNIAPKPPSTIEAV